MESLCTTGRQVNSEQSPLARGDSCVFVSSWIRPPAVHAVWLQERTGVVIGKHDSLRWITSDGRISNLSLAETRCKCMKCESNSMQQRIIDLFQALREKVGKPITPTSGMRCAER